MTDTLVNPPGSSEWEAAPDASVTTEKLDNSVKLMQKLRKEYEDKKGEASAANEEYEKAESQVLALLKASGKTKYFVENLGTVSIRNRYVVRTPKGITEKVAFFSYVENRHGKDALLGLQTINHQTLNSFYNAEVEANPSVTVPGIDAPTHEESLTFRSK